MHLNDYLKETFGYNAEANKGLLKKIAVLDDPSECVRLFSHLINCQYKWMARITADPKAPDMSWWDPLYRLDELAGEWDKSLQPWLDYVDQRTEEELSAEVRFIGLDGGSWAASPKDIALQLNYHSIHHRAQMQTIIRSQGVEPDFVDYIRTKARKLSQ